MDIIYTEADRTDIGVLTNFSIDYEENAVDPEENTFEISQNIADSPLEMGYYFYVANTCYGGRIESVKVDTSKKSITWIGRTWRGMLSGKVLEPAADEEYYTVSGDANSVLAEIIEKIDFGDLFEASTEDSGIDIDYQFFRYTDAFTGIHKMLSSAGAKLDIKWVDGYVVLSALPITDFSNQSELSSDLFDFKIEKSLAPVNHMIGIAISELEDRLVVHRYIGEDGEITDQKYYEGLEEVVAVHEKDKGSTSEEDLILETEEKLLDTSVPEKMKITANNITADLGDKFTAYEMNTGITVSQYVVTKISEINDYNTKITYEVGSDI